ncbi:MAG TPA: hypothetical protein VFB42_13220 [Gaiellaceae bacterium]|nr:hypothetical protein [Gaiellaceae bacterium]
MRSVPWRERPAATAFAAYALTAFGYFGAPLLPHPGRHYIGTPADPQIFIWSFAWWPHAIVHGLDPFHTSLIWAPTGESLAWRTTTPALALAFSPLTWLAGPVISYDVAVILMPALSAWTAFLLCRHLTGRFWPSLAGGYVFGFSSYMVGQLDGHLHMSSVFLLPLVALVTLRYVQGQLDGTGAALRLGPLLAVQLALSYEVSFTAALALVTALALGWLLVPAARHRIVSFVPAALAGYAFAAVLTAPVVYYALAHYTSESINDPAGYTTDLLNLVVPTRRTLLGGSWTGTLADHFAGNDSERNAYVGIPLALVFLWFGARRLRLPGSRFLLAATLAAVIASFGFWFEADGEKLFTLPWEHVGYRPLFNNVLPSRLMVFAFLCLAAVLALWAAGERRGWLRYGLPALVIASLVPSLQLPFWRTATDVPAFFTGDGVRRCLARNETVMILPLAKHGNGMLQQAVSGFRFRMADGYVAPDPPSSFLTSPVAGRVAYGQITWPDLKEFAHEKGVTSVLVEAGQEGPWLEALRPLAPPEEVDGELVYRLDRGRRC